MLDKALTNDPLLIRLFHEKASRKPETYLQSFGGLLYEGFIKPFEAVGQQLIDFTPPC